MYSHWQNIIVEFFWRCFFYFFCHQCSVEQVSHQGHFLFYLYGYYFLNDLYFDHFQETDFSNQPKLHLSFFPWLFGSTSKSWYLVKIPKTDCLYSQNSSQIFFFFFDIRHTFYKSQVGSQPLPKILIRY